MRRVLKTIAPYVIAAFLASAGMASFGCSTHVRYYDADHNDWHRWDDHEDRAYRRYWDDKHSNYREFTSLNDNEKKDYWKWRHDHPDADKH
jgi:hypothetical protein